ncbi:hypothetical protein ACFWUP_26425 [Nocardia sp. NPDC058658]|uniref:hypothetical protein n=1 Tax=Nocardia sp. NPDC058658 TaxID=3346580 RepID=UPI00365F9AE4
MTATLARYRRVPDTAVVVATHRRVSDVVLAMAGTDAAVSGRRRVSDAAVRPDGGAAT